MNRQSPKEERRGAKRRLALRRCHNSQLRHEFNECLLLFCCSVVLLALERCKFSLYIPPTDNCWLLKARLNSTLIPGGKRSLRYPLSLRRFLWDLGCHIEIRREAFETFNVDATDPCFEHVFSFRIQQSRLRESRVVLSLPVHEDRDGEDHYLRSFYK